jgi:predicted membrane protein
MTTTTDPRPTTAAATPPPAFTPPPPPNRSLAAATVGLALVAIGILALLGAIGVEIPLAVLGPSLLVLLGLGVIASAIRGESSGGLVALAVFLGIVLAIAALFGSVLDVPLRGAIGDRAVAPTTAAELEDEYRMLMGTLVVDLRDVELAPGTTELAVSTVLGEVEVRVPEGIPVDVDSSVAAGSATVLGVTHDGVAVDNDQRSDDWDGADQRLQLTVGAGLGEVRVTR